MKAMLKKHASLLLLAALAIVGCQKEKDIIYEVNDVNVSNPDGNKDNVKSLTEFISIAYTDLFGENISQAQLQTLAVPYAGFGDLKLIEDLIIKNFLNEPTVELPSSVEMRADVDAFVFESYQKLFNRDPNEFELWYVSNLIDENQGATPELVYYSLMTSNEYRYY